MAAVAAASRASVCQAACLHKPSASARVAGARPFLSGTALRAVQNGSTRVMAAERALWRPGSEPPAHLDGSLPGDFGFDPLGLGADPERLRWFREAELVNGRWAMLGVAGILGQEILRPDVFWYTAGKDVKLPFNIVGLVAFEFFAFHYVEVRRWQDWRKPNSVNKDPLFSNFGIPDHDPGYPGGIFAPVIPGNLDELKLKEIKNARLAMLAFAGFVMAAQVTGLNPLAALAKHISDPVNTTIFSKAVVTPTQLIKPPCALPESVQYNGITIPTPCFLEGLWP